jgi:hypothetical protein
MGAHAAAPGKDVVGGRWRQDVVKRLRVRVGRVQLALLLLACTREGRGERMGAERWEPRGRGVAGVCLVVVPPAHPLQGMSGAERERRGRTLSRTYAAARAAATQRARSVGRRMLQVGHAAY